jgi:hypothetical protein
MALTRTSEGLELAQERMDHHAVADLDGDLHQVFVRAVQRIARLERHHRRPALGLEQPARLGRGHVDIGKIGGETAL